MEGFTALEINLDGDGAWPELKEIDFDDGKATHIAVLPAGMSSGSPSIAIRGRLNDGREVVLQTSWRLLLRGLPCDRGSLRERRVSGRLLPLGVRPDQYSRSA